MDECKRYHDTCPNPSDRRELPKRVIGIGDFQGALEPFLYETDGHDYLNRGWRYATLSHCWGKAKMPLRTLKSNLEQMKPGIPVSALSKSFKGAMWIARRLSFRYLWIDSPCIIQDDADDWATESGKMGCIFMNSTLIIAATVAASGSNGILQPRLAGRPLFSSENQLYVRQVGLLEEGHRDFRKDSWSLRPPASYTWLGPSRTPFSASSCPFLIKGSVLGLCKRHALRMSVP